MLPEGEFELAFTLPDSTELSKSSPHQIRTRHGPPGSFLRRRAFGLRAFRFCQTRSIPDRKVVSDQADFLHSFQGKLLLRRQPAHNHPGSDSACSRFPMFGSPPQAATVTATNIHQYSAFVCKRFHNNWVSFTGMKFNVYKSSDRPPKPMVQ